MLDLFCLGRKCVRKSQCSCEYDDGSGVVDLSSLGERGMPLFYDVKGPIGSNYSYSPCYPFTEGTCKEAAICMSNKTEGTYEVLGSNSMTLFQYDFSTQNVIIIYRTYGKSTTSHVFLICDKSTTVPHFEVTGKPGPDPVYYFELRSEKACPYKKDKANPIQQQLETLNKTMKSVLTASIAAGVLLSLILILVLTLLLCYMRGCCHIRRNQDVAFADMSN